MDNTQSLLSETDSMIFNGGDAYCKTYMAKFGFMFFVIVSLFLFVSVILRAMKKGQNCHIE